MPQPASRSRQIYVEWRAFTVTRFFNNLKIVTTLSYLALAVPHPEILIQDPILSMITSEILQQLSPTG